MANDRASIFISHKVACHRRAAHRIKAILESHTERLDVYICEETPAGERWREWIESQISRSDILLVLLPPTAADLTWLSLEIGKFQTVCPDGRLVVLKPAAHP